MGLLATCAGPGGGIGGPDPPEKSQKYRVFSDTCPDTKKFTKLPSHHSMLGRHRHASETWRLGWRADDALKWRFAGGPMMARF